MSRANRRKKMNGICVYCGKNKLLTFEHIPPKSCDNNKQIKVIDSIDYFLSNEKYSDYKGKYEQKKAFGHHILCSSCNSLLGKKTVPFFKSFFEKKVYIDGNFKYAYVEYDEAEYLGFVKHALFMLNAKNTKKMLPYKIRDFINEGNDFCQIDGYYHWRINSPKSKVKQMQSGPVAIGYKNENGNFETRMENKIIHNHLELYYSNKEVKHGCDLFLPQVQVIGNKKYLIVEVIENNGILNNDKEV